MPCYWCPHIWLFISSRYVQENECSLLVPTCDCFCFLYLFLLLFLFREVQENESSLFLSYFPKEGWTPVIVVSTFFMRLLYEYIKNKLFICFFNRILFVPGYDYIQSCWPAKLAGCSLPGWWGQIRLHPLRSGTGELWGWLIPFWHNRPIFLWRINILLN